MRTHKIAAIPTDGIGPEVIEAGIAVLKALAERMGDLKLEFRTFDWGTDYYRQHGSMMPKDGLEQVQPVGAIHSGAVGAPEASPEVSAAANVAAATAQARRQDSKRIAR